MSERTTEEGLRRIYRDTIDALYGYASRRCGGDRARAEDVTQEAWLRAVRDWRRTGIPDNPIGWLTTVARNLILNDQRRRVPLPLDDITEAEIFAAIESNTVSDSADVATVVNAALARLPQAEAKLLESFHYDRCKMAQIAEVYGISERAVEGRLRRARERLRKELVITLRSERGIA